MAEERASVRKPAVAERRPAVAARTPAGAAAVRQMPAARALQQRLGNRGTQAYAAQVVARSSAPRVASAVGAAKGQLSISEPGDVHEREADGVADHVMRLADPASRRSNASPASKMSLGALIQGRCAECEEEAKGVRVQAKLTISEPGDALENEADRVADTVMRMPTPPPPEPATSATSGEASAQRKAKSATAPEVSAGVEADVRTLQGAGSPLPASTRQFFEPRFSADFSQVRVNTGGRAQETARSLGARAFTVGRSISFGAGQFAPGTQEGQRLLAHELTHVVQQDAGVRPIGTPVQQGDGAEDGSPAKVNRVNLSLGNAADTPHLQAAWYNFHIPFTDYEFDPSLEGLKTAADLAADKAKEGAIWVKDKVVEGAEWIVEHLKSLINSGIEWLTKKFNDIQEFATSSFEDIKAAVRDALGGITNPLGLITNAIGAMDAGILSSAWSALTAGANAAWQVVKAAVNGVLAFGSGIWNTVSGYVDRLFGVVDSLLDSTAFDLLPGFIQAPIRNLYKKVRDLWTSIRDFWTDLWNRLTAFVNQLLVSIEAFVRKVLSYAIGTVIETVKKLKEIYEFVKRFANDPESVVEPIITSIAAKINAEAPGKAREVAQQKMAEAWASRPPSKSSGVRVHRAPDATALRRATATRDQVNTNVNRELAAQWAKLDISTMLWETFKNLFWPPATIQAIGHEFFELWNTDWKNAADSLFAPRSIFDDFAGFWHDVWSNFLVLLDFPLALLRRLNSILMLLMGYVTILLILVGLVGGAIVGNVPGALAGAAAGAKLAWAIGEALFLSFLLVESASALKAFIDLYTARQTEPEKQRDYLQIAASTIGIGVAIVVAILFTLFGALVRGIVGRIKGAPPKLPSGGEPPKQPPPGRESPAQRGPEPAKTEPPGTEPPKTESDPVTGRPTLQADVQAAQQRTTNLGERISSLAGNDQATLRPKVDAVQAELARLARETQNAATRQKVERLRDALERVNDKLADIERSPLLELGLRGDAIRAFERLENIKSDPVGEVNQVGNKNHYRAARREAAGEVVARRPGDNRPYSHIGDLQRACDGLDNVRRALLREIDNPPRSVTERGARVLQNKYSEVQALLSRLRGFLNSIGQGNFPPYHEFPPGT